MVREYSERGQIVLHFFDERAEIVTMQSYLLEEREKANAEIEEWFEWADSAPVVSPNWW